MSKYNICGLRLPVDTPEYELGKRERGAVEISLELWRVVESKSRMERIHGTRFITSKVKNAQFGQIVYA